MRDRIVRTGKDRIDYSKFSNHPSQVIGPTTEIDAPLPDRPAMTKAEFGHGEAYRHLRIARLLRAGKE